jgi:hypothetical protein
MRTEWRLRGKGYEFCNCNFGCGCNFGGFPSSTDGSCRAFVGMAIAEGACGDVPLSGVRCAAIIDWPKAIHEGGGKSVFIVDPSTTDEQVDALAQICSGKLGGMPWELLAPTHEVIGLERAKISIEGEGLKSVFLAEGLVEARGDTFKNPVTGEDHFANLELPDGFIWKRGACGQGTFRAKAGGLILSFDRTNWILYDFDWSNAPARTAAA